MKKIKEYRIPKHWIFFDKYPFAVLHDGDGNEVLANWMKAKEELMKGKIIARRDALGGFFYQRIKDDQLQTYNPYNKKWVDEDIAVYNTKYEDEQRGIGDPRHWLITNILNER